jgi:hypothetical protein
MEDKLNIEIRVTGGDSSLKEAQESLCQEVFGWFGSELPERKVICLLDHADTPELDSNFGNQFRGFHFPLLESGYNILPQRIIEMISDTFTQKDGFETLIYLHHRALESEISIILTLSHEIQHFIQHGNHKKLWTADSLLRNLSNRDSTLGLQKWSDFPSEIDAIVKSKKVAVSLRDEQSVWRNG